MGRGAPEARGDEHASDQPQGTGAQGQGAAQQFINATSFWVPMRKSLGDKRREIPLHRAQDIVKILATFEDCEDGDTRKITKDGKVTKDGKEEEASVSVIAIYPTTHFGFRKITVERPLRLSFQATPERIARLDDEKRFQALAQSKKKSAAAAKQQAEGRAMQEKIRELLRGFPDTSVKDREEFERMLDAALEKAALQLSAPARKAILSALSRRTTRSPWRVRACPRASSACSVRCGFTTSALSRRPRSGSPSRAWPSFGCGSCSSAGPPGPTA